MLSIATPMSQLFDDPAAARRIIAASDCLEARDRSLDASWPGQKLLHLEAELFHDWSTELKNYLAAAIRGKPELELVSFHLGSCYPHPVVVGRAFQPNGTACSRAQLLRTAAANVGWLRSVCGQIAIAVENNNYYPNPAYDHVTDGDFISELVGGNGIGLVLDLAHAEITAHNRRLGLDDYLDSLPLAAALQIHICRSGIAADGLAFDAHELPDRAVLDRAAALIDRWPQVRYLTVEYYRDAGRLIETLERCRELKGAVKV